MTSKFQTIARLALIALTGTMLTAAGEIPIAAATAVNLIVAPGPSQEIDAETQVGPAIVTIAEDEAITASRPGNLTQLVARVIDAAPSAYGDRECLARAVYFEARGEPLEGQLAVAQVILNRVASGRFATTVCGVISQHGQFSFDRARVPADGRDWRVAKAIAAIAATAGWEMMAPKATAFHATRISASWSTMRKVGTIGNHIFFR